MKRRDRRKFEGQDMAGIVITLAAMIGFLGSAFAVVASLIYVFIKVTNQ